MNGCWIKLKLKELEETRAVPRVCLQERKLQFAVTDKNFCEFCQFAFERESEKKIREKQNKNCECVECTTAAYGCLCCYLLHQRKKNSCTHKRGWNIYKFLPILNANFMLFFHILATMKKKRKFLLSVYAVLLTTTPNQRDWIENRTNMYAIHTVGISRAYDNRDFFLFMYSFMHTFHKFHASHLRPSATHANFSHHHQSASCCTAKNSRIYICVWCTRKYIKREKKFWKSFNHPLMHFLPPSGLLNAHIHKITICTNTNTCEGEGKRERKRWKFFGGRKKVGNKIFATEKCACVF